MPPDHVIYAATIIGIAVFAWMFFAAAMFAAIDIVTQDRFHAWYVSAPYRILRILIWVLWPAIAAFYVWDYFHSDDAGEVR